MQTQTDKENLIDIFKTVVNLNSPEQTTNFFNNIEHSYSNISEFFEAAHASNLIDNDQLTAYLSSIEFLGDNFGYIKKYLTKSIN